MIPWLVHTPAPPDWHIDWPSVEAIFPDASAMAACQQEPRYHAEGDVWTHTRLACEALAESPGFRERPPDERALLFTTVLLHDVGKPACTRLDLDGRISSRGHARRGAIHVRELLWRLGAPFAFREQVAALIRHHQVPFHLFADPDPDRKVITVSQTARCDLLTLVAEADARGRVCLSLDRIRLELGVKPHDDQGAVANHAPELARGYLRRGEPFAWNATNVSRDMRSRGIDLCADYGARIRLVYVEAPATRLFEQNRAREHPVPMSAIERLIGRWEVPDLTEAHRVELAVAEA